MRTVILIPCYNEGLTIKNVIEDFRRNMPDADIYVYDNNSSDDTAVIDESAGAIVCHEPCYTQFVGTINTKGKA